MDQELAVIDYRKKVFNVCEDNIRNGLWRKIVINDLEITRSQLLTMDKDGSMNPFLNVIEEALQTYGVKD